MITRLVQLRFWVACMITLLAAATAPALGIEANVWALGLVFFCSLGIYNLDHVVDDEPELGRWPLALALFSALISAGLLLFAEPRVRWLTLGGALVSCLYFVPFRLRSRWVRAENLPGIKPLFIGTAVASASVLLPWLQVTPRLEWWPPLFALIAVRSLLCAANTLLFDLRDADRDRVRGIPTAPLARGKPFTRALSSGLLVTAALLAAVSHALQLSSLRVLIAQLGTAAGLLLATWLLSERTPRALFAVSVDGLLALPWLVMLG